MSRVEQWWSQGQHVRLRIDGAERSIFVRRAGTGAAMTLLHGFPSSSHDWARIVPSLSAKRALLMPDFLGFGASEKPREHEYSLHEQADLVEALWAHEGITATALLAHDYAVSVTQELLAREAEGSLAVRLDAVHFLNGGIYPDIHRAQPTQKALLDSEQGPQISALLNEELFTQALQASFAEGFDARSDCAEIWEATSREEGHRIAHRLIRYIPDRERHHARWTGALETTAVPISFVWGMLDPISGAHMAERIRERIPAAPLLALADIGHWPALEAPQRVVAAIGGS